MSARSKLNGLLTLKSGTNKLVIRQGSRRVISIRYMGSSSTILYHSTQLIQLETHITEIYLFGLPLEIFHENIKQLLAIVKAVT